MLFAALDANPHFKAVLELDPYTIKRMKEGEQFEFEKYKRDLDKSSIRDLEGLEQLRKFIKRGQIEIIGGAYTQPILHTIGEESVIRQFTCGIPVVEDILGTPVLIYGYQENGACSQIPQICNAAGFEGVVSTTFFGGGFSDERKKQENFYWLGSDGSTIHSVASYCVSMPGNHTHEQALPNSKQVAEMKKNGFVRPLFGTFRDFFTGYAPTVDLPILKSEIFTLWRQQGIDSQVRHLARALPVHWQAIRTSV